VFITSTVHATANKLSAKELCADDFWKWCSSNEAPFDCFKRRGFFKKDSVLSMDCRRAWAKPKQEPEQTAQSNPPKQQELRAQERQPSQQNLEEPKEVVAPRKPSSEPAKTPVPQPEIIDDFSELSFD
jgi:hypothetical protein